jgi:hypothetical protein
MHLMRRGNVSSISTYLTRSGKRRIFQRRVCGQSFPETRDTVFFDLRTVEDKVMMALKMLLVKVELSGVCFVLGVTEEAILEWLRRAAGKAYEINEHLLRSLPVTEVQFDEMWNFIERKSSKDGGPDRESSENPTIASATFFLEQIQQVGFRIDPLLMQNAKRLAGNA